MPHTFAPGSEYLAAVAELQAAAEAEDVARVSAALRKFSDATVREVQRRVLNDLLESLLRKIEEDSGEAKLSPAEAPPEQPAPEPRMRATGSRDMRRYVHAFMRNPASTDALCVECGLSLLDGPHSALGAFANR